VLGVQFHPERMGQTMRPLFDHFVRLTKHRNVSESPSSV